MSNPTIKERIKEFEELVSKTEDRGGWYIPYEGPDETKIIKWLKTTLPLLWKEAEEVGRNEARTVIKMTNEDYDNLNASLSFEAGHRAVALKEVEETLQKIIDKYHVVIDALQASIRKGESS